MAAAGLVRAAVGRGLSAAIQRLRAAAAMAPPTQIEDNCTCAAAGHVLQHLRVRLLVVVQRRSLGWRDAAGQELPRGVDCRSLDIESMHGAGGADGAGKEGGVVAVAARGVDDRVSFPQHRS